MVLHLSEWKGIARARSLGGNIGGKT